MEKHGFSSFFFFFMKDRSEENFSRNKVMITKAMEAVFSGDKSQICC